MLSRNLILSIIFSFLVGLLGALVPILFFLSFFIKNSYLADKGAKLWSVTSIWLLRKLCNVDYKIIGKENIPNNQPFIIACKHQSMWETIIMHIIFDRPVYTYKKELLKIPFYGWFVAKMSSIAIDRKGGASSIKYLLKRTKFYLDKKQNIIIFPQGTRTPINSNIVDYPYQSGIAALYNNFNVKIIPTALNSGEFWSKDKIEKKSGTIIIKFLPAIKQDLNKKDFLLELQESIENGCKEINGS